MTTRLGDSETVQQRGQITGFSAPPCAMEPQFLYLWSTPLCSAHWMLIDGDPGASKMGIPSHNGDP